MEDIDKIIGSSLKIKRALAVKMILNGFSFTQIFDLIGVSQSFVEKWRALYNKEGSDCFKVKYKGREALLSKEQLKEVYQFIKSKITCQLEELISYIQNKFGIEFKSKQSYYDLLDKAGMSWKKTEKINPKKDDAKVASKKEEVKKNSLKEKRKYSLGNWSF